jgi:hypothetical protein
MSTKKALLRRCDFSATIRIGHKADAMFTGLYSTTFFDSALLYNTMKSHVINAQKAPMSVEKNSPRTKPNSIETSLF